MSEIGLSTRRSIHERASRREESLLPTAVGLDPGAATLAGPLLPPQEPRAARFLTSSTIAVCSAGSQIRREGKAAQFERLRSTAGLHVLRHRDQRAKPLLYF